MFFYRYVSKGKGILQRHHLIDELGSIAKEDEGMQKLTKGPFEEVLQSAQVKLKLSFDILLVVLETYLYLDLWSSLCNIQWFSFGSACNFDLICFNRSN